MEPVLSAPWKIIFPAILCLAETAPTGPVITEGTAAEMKISLSVSGDTVTTVHCPLPFATAVDVALMAAHISRGCTVILTLNVTAHGENTVVTAGGSTTTNVRGTTGEVGNNVVGSKLEGPILGCAAHTTTPDVSSMALEGSTESTSPSVNGAASTTPPSAPYVTSLGPESVATATQTGAGLDVPGSDISFLGEDFASTENPEDLTLPSTENFTGTVAVETNTPQQEETTIPPVNASPTLRKSTVHAEENTTCHPNCGAFPGWATVLLCLTMSFFIFMLVGFLFLFPYWTKVAHPTAVPCSSAHRTST
ncbi:uncharacterized protein LOC144327046 [Podarcis muralis]